MYLMNTLAVENIINKIRFSSLLAIHFCEKKIGQWQMVNNHVIQSTQIHPFSKSGYESNQSESESAFESSSSLR